MKTRRSKAVILLILAVFVLAGVCLWYVNDYYRSDVTIADYQKDGGDVSVTEIEQGLYLDGAGEDTALIFYPGAKVEYTAYLPLLYRLAEQGIDSFLVKMPCNLAIFGQNKADGIMERYDYKNWYLSGHSLGGAMAASYASGHMEDLDGLVLLAAYPTKSMQSEDFTVLSLYGSEDGVLNTSKLEKGRKNMPKHYTELCIEGGNHAGFGDYGEQSGDHKAAVNREEQQEQTVAAILEMTAERNDSIKE